MNKNTKMNWDIFFKSAPITCMAAVTAITLVAAWLFPSVATMYGTTMTEHPSLYLWLYAVAIDLGYWIAEYERRKIRTIQKGLTVTWSILFESALDPLVRLLGQTIAIFIVARWLSSYIEMKNSHAATYPILFVWLHLLAICVGYWIAKYAWMKKLDKQKAKLV